MLEKVILKYTSEGYKNITMSKNISIGRWLYFLTHEIEDLNDAKWYLNDFENAVEGEICSGFTTVLFLENNFIIIRREWAQDEEIEVGRCEYEAAKQLLRDWARVLEEKPEQVTLVQEGDRLSLVW